MKQLLQISCGGTLSVTIIIIENGIDNQSSNPEQVCVSLQAIALGEGINQSALLSALGKW